MLARFWRQIVRLPIEARFALLGLALLAPAMTAKGLAARVPAPAAEPEAARGPAAPSGTPPEATPPAPGRPAPEAPAERGAPEVSIAITRLRVGAPPFTWAEGAPEERGGRRLATFVTDSDRRCTVVAWARAQGAQPEEIRWTVTPPAGFGLPAAGLPSGPRLRVALERPAGNPKGGGGPLTITVRAAVERDGRTFEASETVTQDERDQMRQEYVDLRREIVPERYHFLDAAAYEQIYGKRFPQIRFEELNWSVNPDTGEHFRYAIIAQRLLEGLARARAIYGRPLLFSSGYRNPTRQVEVHAPVKESLHQYGLAADLSVFPDTAQPHTGRTSPNEGDWLYFAESACAAGAQWVEPMTDCAVNTPGCHLHMDFRPDGPRTAVVVLQGRVLDAESGEPVAGAEVKLGGMPSRTDAGGRFCLRNVLTPRERPVDVLAQGYQPLTQTVPVTAGVNGIDLHLASGPRPRLTATVERVAWQNERAGTVVAAVCLRNKGQRAARSVAVAPVTPAAAPAILVTPPQLAGLPVGAQSRVRLSFKVEPATAPPPAKVVLRLAAEDPDGVPRTQRLVLFCTPPAPTPPATVPSLPQPKHAEIGAAALVAAAAAAAAARRRPPQPQPPAKAAAPAREPVAAPSHEPVPPQGLPEEPSLPALPGQRDDR
jgi:Carboxypeptidase regulatory-like domain/Peptidase M15